MPKGRAFGKAGDRIPGSRLLRDYCKRCDEPIRVNEVFREWYDINHGKMRMRVDNYCENCGAYHKKDGWKYLTPAQKMGNKKIWSG